MRLSTKDEQKMDEWSPKKKKIEIFKLIMSFRKEYNFDRKREKEWLLSTERKKLHISKAFFLLCNNLHCI